jgi:hypothetical protein
LAFLHVVFLHPWDLEMSTKTCSNNMVSPNDHVVMNHQNQTPNKWHMRPCSLQEVQLFLWKRWSFLAFQMCQRSKRVWVKFSSVGLVENRWGIMCCTPSKSGFIRWVDKGVLKLAHTCWGKSHKKNRCAYFQWNHRRHSVYQCWRWIFQLFWLWQGPFWFRACAAVGCMHGLKRFEHTFTCYIWSILNSRCCTDTYV